MLASVAHGKLALGGDAMLFDLSGLDVFGLVLTAAFSFLIGKLRRKQSVESKTAVRDMQRAKAIIQEFEGIAAQLQQAVQQHQQEVTQFKDRVNAAALGRPNVNWDDFSIEAERILKPTLALADQVARAYDQIKLQSNVLVNLQESRLDALTGVGNRRMFDETIESYRALFNRYGKHFSLAMIDIDHFKKINDTHGHLYGDHALSTVGALLRDLARETDIVARYGGEEFVILMPETPLDGAAIFCERVRQEIESKANLTVSIGTASTADYGITDDLIQAADQALYHAKEAGRNLVCASNSDGCHIVLREESPTLPTPSPAASNEAETALA
jgi:diguanylate cyclase (GGDEF)-like protein